VPRLEPRTASFAMLYVSCGRGRSRQYAEALRIAGCSPMCTTQRRLCPGTVAPSRMLLKCRGNSGIGSGRAQWRRATSLPPGQLCDRGALCARPLSNHSLTTQILRGVRRKSASSQVPFGFIQWASTHLFA
jgi:hypothetical protein